MGYADSHAVIENEFVSAWTETRIAHENEHFDPMGLDEWVRFVNLTGGGGQASLGNNPLYRYRGIVVVQIFVLPNTGWARADELADLVTPIYRSRRISDVQFGVPVATRMGERDGWHQVNVDCPYYREEY